jgi:hypothetical protein
MAISNIYYVIEANELAELAKKVNKALSNGDETVGGVSAYYNPFNNAFGGITVYLQAMCGKG